ncbi:hypothetical protein Clacol_000240 [Clathrus columnatus]|uniref:AAA+ ATPase domain-containing protein n=1 Tax=Clathrus columnatus TaxID=1419009 RepID=A0AAV4ZY19_9AGAM|nr:hypothetical protein Clacol_000240 [Clathrus columnatus]
MPVLGKRTRNVSPSPTPTITRRRAAVNQHDLLLTPEPTPNPKRPRPSSSITLTPFDDGSNKENIPPESIDFTITIPRSRTQQRVLPQPQPSPPATPTVTHVTSSRTVLRAQNHNDTSPLIGRDRERDKILNFLNPFLADAVNDHSPVGLYISGAPGTGKTAIISELVSSLSMSHNSTIRVISINCMALEDRDLNGVWERCAQELHIARSTKRTSSLKGDWSKQFCKLFDDKKCLLVLDEIDNLVSPTCSITDIFDIAADSTSTAFTRLRIIGISNTHTLNNAKPLRGIETLHFEPYTAPQMKAVLTSRLTTISPNSSIFPIPTIALLCMKIASQTGDIRMLFSVARRALDLAIQGSKAPDMPSTVSPAHVLAALKVCNASNQGKSGNETVTRVRNLGLQARFALASLLIASRRVNSGLSLTSTNSSPNSKLKKENMMTPAPSTIPLIDVTALHGFYTTILGTSAFLGLGRTEFVDLINLLEGNGLVQLNTGRKGRSKCVQTTVSIARDVREEELVRGLIGNDGAQLDVKEEEVNRMWHREIVRIERETKYKATTYNQESCFKDAEKD